MKNNPNNVSEFADVEDCCFAINFDSIMHGKKNN